ncbi:MAG: hypothetical protein ACXADY_12500 [Candidatus Hodarchaeales archaeon]|jgi:hypothetical protein
MKSIDVDAKQLIRTYIDGIEEYLREHTRLHPNEIDGLLNEINDFVYLRSGELASDERVHYNDVLKAIEECGSPSEICEQYLELDREEQPAPFSPKVPTAITSSKAVFQPSKVYSKEVTPDSMKFPYKFRGLNNYYQQFPRFTIFRIFFLLFIVFLNLALLNYNSILEGAPWYWTSINLSPYFIHELGFYSLQTVTFTAFFLVLLEGFLINRWKTKLVREKGMDRSFDDSLIVWISRFTFLLVFFKSSLLFFSSYLVFVPIWIFLAIIIERQMKSQFWEEKLGPWFISFGSTLTNPQNEQSQFNISSYWSKLKNHFTSQEKKLFVILLGILGLTFLFPWIGFKQYMRWNGSPQTYYNVSSLPFVASIFVLLCLIVMLGTLGALKYYQTKNVSQNLKSLSGESELIAWMMRLIALRAILILGFFNDPFFVYLGVISIIVVLLASEIITNTYGGKSFRVLFGQALVMLGSSQSTIDGSPQKFSRNNTIEQPPSSVLKKQSSIAKSRVAVSYSQVPTNVSLPRNGVTEPAKIREQVLITQPVEVKYDKKPSMLSQFFKGIGELVKAFIMTILMLSISFFEVVLAFVVVATSYSYSASFEVTVFEFNGGYFSLMPFNYSPSNPVGFMFSMWHTLLLLGIQLFFIAILQWYSLATRKPEGIILKVCRNLTRILLAVVIIGTLVHIFNGDIYAEFRLLIVFVLVFFSELTAWKIHSERKKFISSSSEQESVGQDNEGIVLTQAKSTKTSH